MKKIYKILPLLFLIVFSNLNISSYSSEMYCWEETRHGDFIKNNKNATNAKATDSYLYDTLKDKATIIPVGVVSYKNIGAANSDYGYGYNQISTRVYYTNYLEYNYGGQNSGNYYADATFLKFCAVFNSSGSSSGGSSGGSSGAATASVNYIIKAK